METVPGDAAEQASAHRAFHLSLVALAGHQHLMRVYEPVLLQLQLYMATNMRREAEQRPTTEGARRHRRLYEAVAGGDLDVVLDELAHHGSRTYLAPELGHA
jgi:DNA-binding GntR family transcriptional regulator